MVHWIACVVGDLCAEMSIKNCTLFTNVRLRGKSIVTASNVPNGPQAVRLCKTILGRDRIPYDWKHEMVQNPTFVSPAVIVVTYNVNISNATVGAYDERLLGTG